MRIVGTVESGGGFHADNQARFAQQFTRACGYRPYPGSLNVRVDAWPDLGRPAATVRGVDRTYRLWPATVVGVDGPAHMMCPWADPPRPVVEVLAPIRLRDVLALEDGDEVAVIVG